MQRFLDRLDGQPVWEGLLKELSHLVPPMMELDELAMEMDERQESAPLRVHIKGRLMSAPGSEGEHTGGIAQFVEALEQSVFFAQMDLSSSEIGSGQDGVTNFSIDGRLE